MVVVGRRRSTRTPAPPLLSTRPSGMSRRRRRAFAALFAALCVSRVVLVCGSADDASSRTAPADGAESHLSSRLRDIAADVEANADYVIRLRRELHLVPELMWTEVKTSAIVKRELDAMGIAHADLSPRRPRDDRHRRPRRAPPRGHGRAPHHRGVRHPPRATQRPPGKDARLRPRRPRRHAPRRRPRAQIPRVHPLGHRPSRLPTRRGGRRRRATHARERLADARPPIDTSFALHNWPYRRPRAASSPPDRASSWRGARRLRLSSSASADTPPNQPNSSASWRASPRSSPRHRRSSRDEWTRWTAPS